MVQLCAYKPYIWYIDCRYCIYHCAIKCNVKLWHFRGKKFPGQISSGFRFCLKFSGFVHFSKSIIQLLSKQCLVMITHVQDVPRTSGSGFCFDTNPVSYKPQFWSLHDLRNFLVKIIFSRLKWGDGKRHMWEKAYMVKGIYGKRHIW